MRPALVLLIVLLLLPTLPPARGQSLVDCPAAPEELTRRCARVADQIAGYRQQIEDAETLLRDTAIILARAEKTPDESTAQYRARVRRQQGVATPESNTWLPVQGYFYNAVQQRIYVALARDGYWHYIWERLAFDPALARETFKRRARRSRREKTYQLENPDSAINRNRYTLETLRVFERECCASANIAPPLFPAPSVPARDPRPEAPSPATPQQP
jgi:hypothetical protein